MKRIGGISFLFIVVDILFHSQNPPPYPRVPRGHLCQQYNSANIRFKRPIDQCDFFISVFIGASLGKQTTSLSNQNTSLSNQTTRDHPTSHVKTKFYFAIFDFGCQGQATTTIVKKNKNNPSPQKKTQKNSQNRAAISIPVSNTYISIFYCGHLKLKIAINHYC